MLIDPIINHMGPDELRAYIAHQHAIDEARGALYYAQDEIIDLLGRLYSEQKYRFECLTRRNIKQDALRAFEREMEQKYDEFVPRPVCACEEEA